MAPAAVQPPEVQFAQRLAANEKRIRDRALKKLRGYIGVRTQRPAGGFSQEEMLKIWKGLFYCMWMQDKPLLQEELAANISQLIHMFQNTEAQHLFIQTFWQTMNREWNGIDNLRLDKYYMLMRLILRQSFEVLKRNEWDEGVVEPLLQLLMKEVMDPDSNSPTGIKFHFIDIYLDELAKVGAKELTADQNLKFIEPFCKIAAKSKDRRVLHAVVAGVFEMIVDQSPFAIEDLMKELGTNSDDEDVSEEDKQENEEMLKTKGDRCPSRKSAQNSEETEDINENVDDGIGAVLQFDYKAVADKIFEFASKKNIPSLNRKRLYKLVKKFQDLAEGIFPQDIPEDVSTDEDDDESGRRKRKKKAVKPWQQNEPEKVKEATEELSSVKVPSVPQRKRKKRKKRDSQSADSGRADGSCEEGEAETSGCNASSQEKVPENNKDRKRKKLLVKEASGTTNVAADNRENPSICVQNSLTDTEQRKKRQLKKMNPKVQNVPAKPACQNRPASARAAEDVSLSVTLLPPKAVKKKQKAGAVLMNGDPPVQQTDLKPSKEGWLGTLPRKAGAEAAPSRKVTLKTKLVGLEGMEVSSQNAATLKKKRKVKEVLNSVEANGVLETVCKKSRKVESSGALSPLKKKKAKPGSDFVKFEKSTVPKAVFFRKARSTISSTRTSMQLNKLQTPSSKKVTFGLNKNMTAEFKKTDKSILVSPEGPSRVAFNPEQKPRHGVLKSPTVTPAKEPQIKRPFTLSAKKRPAAVDFF
ncbi:PREDICTED: ribosomal RNA processing protein 1 homolog B [Pseudopodoces humilis]|uniref:ribosomal RNA processing protein 1 homolog B n=1 Tax=Pseudopodoces humilis TaxID=181119 RepID=UPI0006B6EFC5|nr:PREDICTED: ribosomal RNA processing protein 1 homolog B [Pseudopodoces humilis]